MTVTTRSKRRVRDGSDIGAAGVRAAVLKGRPLASARSHKLDTIVDLR